jgi:hypothetical protein
VAGRPQEAIPRLEEAIGVARQVGARAEEAEALATLASCLTEPGELDRSIALHLEARRLAEQVGDAETVLGTYMTLAETLGLAGRDALDDAREGFQRARQLGLERAIGSYVAGGLAWQLLASGRWAECERFTAEVLTADSWDAHDLHAIRGQLLARQGDFGAAREQLDQARRVRRAAEHDPAWQERIELALWEGNDQAASSAVAEGLRWRVALGPDRGLSQFTARGTRSRCGWRLTRLSGRRPDARPRTLPRSGGGPRRSPLSWTGSSASKCRRPATPASCATCCSPKQSGPGSKGRRTPSNGMWQPPRGSGWSGPSRPPTLAFDRPRRC